MDSPSVFELNAPSSPVQRACDFARDLAYGVTQGLWSTRLHTSHTDANNWRYVLDTHSHQARQIYSDLVRNKWKNEPPSDFLLKSLGYLDVIEIASSATFYWLTEKALRLLEEPASPPTVFISYKRDQSSAFALLIEARLKLLGNPNPFVDKNITPGDEWHGMLEATISNCTYFVSLIGPATLKSSMVLKEIEWAEKAGCTIISIWHGCKIDPASPEVLRKLHAIEVTGESALEYETSVNQLLNALGYQTY